MHLIQEEVLHGEHSHHARREHTSPTRKESRQNGVGHVPFKCGAYIVFLARHEVGTLHRTVPIVDASRALQDVPEKFDVWKPANDSMNTAEHGRQCRTASKDRNRTVAYG
jgi:hypothetical protein